MSEPARVALLVTCLVDLFRPSVGFAAVKLLEQAGCTVEVPAQTCCGQPAYNSGDKADAKAIARQVIALPGAEVCCGFGGTFCIKYPEISDKMVTDKAADIAATGVDAVLAGDLGCLLNIAGKLSRRGSNVEVRHVAEVLADMTPNVPPIGAPAR